MTYLPNPPDDPPDDELSPQEVHDRVDDVVNMTVAEMRRLEASKRNEIYKERNSEAAQPGDEPLDDAIQLMSTPQSDWSDEDDGFNEVQQGQELLDFVDRTAAQGAEKEKEGAMIPEEEPHYGKQEMSLLRWGVDPFPRDDFP